MRHPSREDQYATWRGSDESSAALYIGGGVAASSKGACVGEAQPTSRVAAGGEVEHSREGPVEVQVLVQRVRVVAPVDIGPPGDAEVKFVRKVYEEQILHRRRIDLHGEGNLTAPSTSI